MVESFLQDLRGIDHQDTFDDMAEYDDEEYDEKEIPFYLNEKSKPIVNHEKTGRNDPCPCGSGKKYKKCCLNKKNGPFPIF